MNGIELAVRFSYITNSLRYCGPESAEKLFLNLFEKKSTFEDLSNALKKFEGLYPYLDAIAKKNSKKFTDYDVVEAYWIGNELLDIFTDEDMKNIITNLINHGLPKSIGEELIKKLPSEAFPHHNFNVFCVGVGNITGAVEATLENMDYCMISTGKVLEIVNNLLIVETRPLKLFNNKISFGEPETKSAKFHNNMLPEIKKGDVVALHWGFACMILDEKQQNNLEKYTQKVIDMKNSIIN